jgi:hypothetical protein
MNKGWYVDRNYEKAYEYFSFLYSLGVQGTLEVLSLARSFTLSKR